jgi:hypothetical protein
VSIIDASVIAEFYGIVQGTGEAVTFSHTVPGTYDSATDTHGAPSAATVAGYAIEVPNEPEEFEPGELVEKQPATLFFMPTDGVSIPPKGATVTWAGTTRTVLRNGPIRPGGVAFATRVILV